MSFRSLHIADLDFPTELYNRDGSFVTPVRYLLELAPAVVENREQLEAKPAIETGGAKRGWRPSFGSFFSAAQSAAPIIQESIKLQTVKVQYDMAKEERERRRQERSGTGTGPGMFDQFRGAPLAQQWSFQATKDAEAIQRELEKQRMKAQRNQKADEERGTKEKKGNGGEKDKGKEKDKDKDKDQQKDKEKDKDEEAKEQEQKRQEMIKGVLVMVAATVTSIASTYYGARQTGKVWFLRQLEELTEEVNNECLAGARYWVAERQRLGLPVPQVVLGDLQRLSRIVDLVERLNTHKEDSWKIAGWGSMLLGSASTATGWLLSSGTAGSGPQGVATGQVIQRFGVGFSLVSMLLLVALKAVHSTPHYTHSRAVLGQELVRDCQRYREDEARHASLVVSAIELAANGQVEANDPAQMQPPQAVPAPQSSQRIGSQPVRTRTRLEDPHVG